MVKETPAADSQMYCTSSKLLLTTRNLSETRLAEEEAYTEMPNDGNDAAGTHGLQERLGTRLGDRPEICSRARSLSYQNQNPRSKSSRELFASSFFVKPKPESSIKMVEKGLVKDRPPRQPSLPPSTIREATLGLPGAALDGCNVDQYHCTRLGSPRGRGSLCPEGWRLSTVQSSGQLIRRGVSPIIGLNSLPLQTSWLAPSFTSQLSHKGKELTGY